MTIKKNTTNVLIIVMLVTLSSFDVPEGWFKWGDDMKSYDMGIDKGSGQDGGNAATIKSVTSKTKGFATLMQNSLPAKYFGKRVRMSGLVKSKNVEGKAGLWLRVDQANSRKSLAFDNMHDRPINGTTDWKKYEIVLDISTNASNIAYGALLSGTGQIWFDKLNFEIVDSTIHSTGVVSEPSNLDFEK